ncbi:unnamed protein product, partial [Closterium sp. NIES-65]
MSCISLHLLHNRVPPHSTMPMPCPCPPVRLHGRVPPGMPHDQLRVTWVEKLSALDLPLRVTWVEKLSALDLPPEGFASLAKTGVRSMWCITCDGSSRLDSPHLLTAIINFCLLSPPHLTMFHSPLALFTGIPILQQPIGTKLSQRAMLAYTAADIAALHRAMQEDAEQVRQQLAVGMEGVAQEVGQLRLASSKAAGDAAQVLREGREGLQQLQAEIKELKARVRRQGEELSQQMMTLARLQEIRREAWGWAGDAAQVTFETSRKLRQGGNQKRSGGWAGDAAQVLREGQEGLQQLQVEIQELKARVRLHGVELAQQIVSVARLQARENNARAAAAAAAAAAATAAVVVEAGGSSNSSSGSGGRGSGVYHRPWRRNGFRRWKITDDRPQYWRQRVFEKYGAYGFVKFSAYRMNARRIAIIGMVPVAMEDKTRLTDCTWHGSDGSRINGDLTISLVGKHHNYIYDVAVLLCTLDSATKAGGHLEARIEQEILFPYREEESEPLEASSPLPLNVAACVSPIHDTIDARRLLEWLHFHRVLLPVDRFLLYDAGGIAGNGEAGPGHKEVQRVLAPRVKRGMVDVTWGFREVLQWDVWNYGEVCTWGGGEEVRGGRCLCCSGTCGTTVRGRGGEGGEVSVLQWDVWNYGEVCTWGGGEEVRGGRCLCCSGTCGTMVRGRGGEGGEVSVLQWDVWNYGEVCTWGGGEEVRGGEVSVLQWDVWNYGEVCTWGGGEEHLAIQDCIYRTRNAARWLLVSDIDEYLQIPPPLSLPALLQEHESLPWLTFGATAFNGSFCSPLQLPPQAAGGGEGEGEGGGGGEGNGGGEEGEEERKRAAAMAANEAKAAFAVERMRFRWPHPVCSATDVYSASQCLDEEGSRRYILDPRRAITATANSVASSRPGINLPVETARLARFPGISQSGFATCTLGEPSDSWWEKEEGVAALAEAARRCPALKPWTKGASAEKCTPEGIAERLIMHAEQTPQSPAVVRNGLSVLGVIPPPSETYSVPISPLPPPASPVRSVGIVYPFEPPSTPADWEPHPSIVLVPGGGEGSSRPSAASPSTIDVTLVSHLVDQTRMCIKNRYLNFEPDHHFGSGEKMTLNDFIQRHQKMDKREVKAEGVDSDGNPVEFSYTLHENPIEGQETDGDVTACFELSLKFVRAVDKELEWRMKDLEELEG